MASSRIRITDIRQIRLRAVGEAGALEPAWNPGGEMRFTLGGGVYTEIRTDQGMTGIGPAAAPEVVAAARSRLVGEDPFEVERHADTLHYYAAGHHATERLGVQALGEELARVFGIEHRFVELPNPV